MQFPWHCPLGVQFNSDVILKLERCDTFSLVQKLHLLPSDAIKQDFEPERPFLTGLLFLCTFRQNTLIPVLSLIDWDFSRDTKKAYQYLFYCEKFIPMDHRDLVQGL